MTNLHPVETKCKILLYQGIQEQLRRIYRYFDILTHEKIILYDAHQVFLVLGMEFGNVMQP